MKNVKTSTIMSAADRLQLHRAGISPDYLSNCVIQNGDIYYLHNTYLESWIERQNHPELFVDERAKAEQLRNVAEVMRNKGIVVLECVIE